MDPVRAIEENGEEFLVALGRAAGAQERDDGRVRWVIGEIPIDYHNCAVRPEKVQRLRDDAVGLLG